MAEEKKREADNFIDVSRFEDVQLDKISHIPKKNLNKFHYFFIILPITNKNNE